MEEDSSSSDGEPDVFDVATISAADRRDLQLIAAYLLDLPNGNNGRLLFEKARDSSINPRYYGNKMAFISREAEKLALESANEEVKVRDSADVLRFLGKSQSDSVGTSLALEHFNKAAWMIGATTVLIRKVDPIGSKRIALKRNASELCNKLQRLATLFYYAMGSEESTRYHDIELGNFIKVVVDLHWRVQIALLVSAWTYVSRYKNNELLVSGEKKWPEMLWKWGPLTGTSAQDLPSLKDEGGFFWELCDQLWPKESEWSHVVSLAKHIIPASLLRVMQCSIPDPELVSKLIQKARLVCEFGGPLAVGTDQTYDSARRIQQACGTAVELLYANSPVEYRDQTFFSKQRLEEKTKKKNGGLDVITAHEIRKVTDVAKGILNWHDTIRKEEQAYQKRLKNEETRAKRTGRGTASRHSREGAARSTRLRVELDYGFLCTLFELFNECHNMSAQVFLNSFMGFPRVVCVRLEKKFRESLQSLGDFVALRHGAVDEKRDKEEKDQSPRIEGQFLTALVVEAVMRWVDYVVSNTDIPASDKPPKVHYSSNPFQRGPECGAIYDCFGPDTEEKTTAAHKTMIRVFAVVGVGTDGKPEDDGKQTPRVLLLRSKYRDEGEARVMAPPFTREDASSLGLTWKIEWFPRELSKFHFPFIGSARVADLIKFAKRDSSGFSVLWREASERLENEVAVWEALRPKDLDALSIRREAVAVGVYTSVMEHPQLSKWVQLFASNSIRMRCPARLIRKTKSKFVRGKDVNALFASSANRPLEDAVDDKRKLIMGWACYGYPIDPNVLSLMGVSKSEFLEAKTEERLRKAESAFFPATGERTKSNSIAKYGLQGYEIFLEKTPASSSSSSSSSSAASASASSSSSSAASSSSNYAMIANAAAAADDAASFDSQRPGL